MKSHRYLNDTVQPCVLQYHDGLQVEGRLNLFHEADDEAVIRLESTATAAPVK